MTGPGPPSNDPPLVAPREDSTTWSSGIALVQDGEALLAAVESGSWKDQALTGIVAGFDVAVTLLDPLGTLVASGVGWLAEHVQPLSDLLDALTGDPDAVAAQARTWRNVAASVRESADGLRRAGAPGPDWTGAAADGFARSTGDHAEHLGGAAVATDVLAAATEGAGQLVTMVREVVRDLISQLVTTLVERVPQWTIEEIGTIGILTPHVVSAALAVTGRVATKVLRLAEGLVRSLEKLGELLARAGRVLDDVAARFARHADARPAPTSAQGATPAPAGSSPSPGGPPTAPPAGGQPFVPPPSRIRETLGPEPPAAPTSVTAGRTGIHRDRHGVLTDGKYRVSIAGQEKHRAGIAPPGRSAFYPGLDDERLALEAAKQADEGNLWTASSPGQYENKAKVVVDHSIGTHSNSGSPTAVVNVYRRKNGTIHVSPGSPQ